MSWKKLLSRHGVDLVTISEIDKVFFSLLAEFSKSEENKLFTVLRNKTLTHYINGNVQELGRLIYKKYFPSKEVIEQYYRDGIDLIERFEEEADKCKNKDLTASFDIFIKLFREVCGIYSIVSWWAIEAWQNDYEQILTTLIKKNGLEEKQEDIFEVLYLPWKKTVLIEIQEKISSGEKVEDLLQEYKFLRSWVAVWYDQLNESWFKEIEKKSKVTTTLTREEAVNLLNPNDEEKVFLEIAPHMIFFKDWRDDLRRKFSYTWHFIFERISKQFSINTEDLGYLTTKEITESLKENSFPKDLIKKRKEFGCIVTSNEENKVIVINSILPKYERILQEIDKILPQEEVNGQVAYPGRVIGPVRIMHTYHDIKKVEFGDILVANTTHPNFLPAMQKAAAFITNEGGVVSHAAIVAREMKKPCIVGTKNATKLLKDYDFVEVDADNGTVRRIE